MGASLGGLLVPVAAARGIRAPRAHGCWSVDGLKPGPGLGVGSGPAWGRSPAIGQEATRLVPGRASVETPGIAQATVTGCRGLETRLRAAE